MEKVIIVKEWKPSKTGKSIGITSMDGETFYAKNELKFTPVIGMVYNFTYEETKANGKTYLWISKYVSQTGKSSEAPKSTNSAEKTDWAGKERRELRAKAYNTAMMTVYPVVMKLTGENGELPLQSHIHQDY